jgi:hypothetical protein
MPHYRIGLGSLFAAAALAMAGCADATVSQVSGKVTVDGNPLEKGAISFYPVDRQAKTAGGEIKDGAYSVQVPVGAMEVRISMPKVVGKKKLYDKKDSPEYPVYQESLPAKYNMESKLQLDVTQGKLEKDWALTSK